MANDASGGIAGRFPALPAVLLVTERRVLVAPSNGLCFDDPVLEVSLGRVMVRA